MKKVPIFFTCDDNYIPYLSVTLTSLIENSSDENIYDIKILHTGILEKNEKIIKKHEKNNVFIEFVNISKEIEHIKQKFHTRDYYTGATYYRLFIPRLYPNIEKCVYLDCDVVVRGDIADFYSFDLEDNLIGGVPDEIVSVTEEFRIYTQKRLGVNYSNYINAGVIIMNLKELRTFEFETKFINAINKVKFKVAQDQDYLNTICKGRIKYLPKVWNKQPIEDSSINNEEIMLLHYNLNLKPWHYENIKYENYFWDYAKKTEFFEFICSQKVVFDDEKKLKDKLDGENLIKLALYEAEVLGEVSIND